METVEPDQPVLRRAQASVDFEVLLQLFRDQQVRRWLFDGREIDATTAWSIVSDEDARPDSALGLWVLSERATPFGFFRLAASGHAPGGAEAELLYGLAPSHWGQGWATRASACLIDRAFGSDGLMSITATVDTPNHASLRVLQRLGIAFEEERLLASGPTQFWRLPRAAWRPEQWRDALLRFRPMLET